MKQFNVIGIGLKGFIQVSVLDHAGNTVLSHPPQRNLLLDRGLDKMADVPICDIFLACAKGTGTDITTEDLTGTANTYTQASFTVTRTAGTRDFTADDVGKLIRTVSGSHEARITGYTDATHVEVEKSDAYTNLKITLYGVDQTLLALETGRTADYSNVIGENGTETASNVRTFTRTFIFPFEDEVKEIVTGTYSQSATTVTRASGSRAFTADDVGKYLAFASGNQVKILTYTDATHVEVDSSATVAATTITLYGWVDYTEIGFSESSVADDPLTVRVLLDTPARVYAANAINPSQQLKVTYSLQLTVTPNTITAGNLNTVISDPGNVMSGNKAGNYTIESFATSQVLPSGITDPAYMALEPSAAGICGLSSVTTTLAPLANTKRPCGDNHVDMENEDYSAGTFSRIVKAVFPIDVAVANNHRSLMIYDPETTNAIFTYLFDAAQHKDGEHVLTIRFKKTWNRDLS